MTRRARYLATIAALAILLVAAVPVPTGAQVNVPVTLSNPAGSRVIHVEDMLGSPLSSLAFGPNRSMPFRVRVVDTQFGTASFTVNATMTHLYRDGGTWTERIDSADVSLGRQVAVPTAVGVSAVVKPVFDLAVTLDSTVCSTLRLIDAAHPCSLSVADVAGKVQTIVLDAASPLDKLPLVPQANETGAFTNPEHGLGTAGFDDPDKTADLPTPRKVAAGALNDVVDIATLTSLLDLTPRTDGISNEIISAALTAAYPLLATLPSGTLAAIVTSTVATVQDLALADILNLTGTYISLPTLDVSTIGAPVGTFTGTLVLTATQ